MEDETVNKFIVQTYDINYKSFSLGAQILKEHLLKKTLRSLLLIFAYKAIGIKDAKKGLKNVKLEELIRSLMSASFILFLKQISHVFYFILLSNYIEKHWIPYDIKIIGICLTLSKKWRLGTKCLKGIKLELIQAEHVDVKGVYFRRT